MSAADFRNTLAGLLRTIASRKSQLYYARQMGDSLPPQEMDCGWFDDMYHPDHPLFHEAFNVTERGRLAAFHAVYAANNHRLPMSLDDRLANPAWAEVMVVAQQVVEEFGWGEGE